MGIRYMFGRADNIYPQFTCDVCNEPINDLSKGNVVWEHPTRDWTDTWSTDRVYFTHKQCDYLLRRRLEQVGILTYWEELSLFPIHVMYNSGYPAAARAAFDTRARPIEPEPTQRTGLALRFSILKRDGYRCQLCGRSAQDGAVLEIDHKVPRAKGGGDQPANLWTLCFDCNRGKSDTDL